MLSSLNAGNKFPREIHVDRSEEKVNLNCNSISALLENGFSKVLNQLSLTVR